MTLSLRLPETDMDKPLFKASDGGYFEMARVTEDRIKIGLQQGSEIPVPVGQKVCPEAFPNGLPMSIGWNSWNDRVY